MLKATLDGITALVLPSAYGVKVGFGVLTVLIVQSATAQPAGSFTVGLPGGAGPSVLNTDPYVLLITGAGGLTIWPLT
ncbi:DUF554 family protein [Deinococcus taeanensis]|uniref:DUF554 family protein n=1 Tax=Deinococcus taeanensis TaxID=2737050 RepID=UPI0021029B97|nr:DUF554 family protein [Deinococcus taeanensis]